MSLDLSLQKLYAKQFILDMNRHIRFLLILKPALPPYDNTENYDVIASLRIEYSIPSN